MDSSRQQQFQQPKQQQQKQEPPAASTSQQNQSTKPPQIVPNQIMMSGQQFQKQIDNQQHEQQQPSQQQAGPDEPKLQSANFSNPVGPVLNQPVFPPNQLPGHTEGQSDQTQIDSMNESKLPEVPIPGQPFVFAAPGMGPSMRMNPIMSSQINFAPANMLPPQMNVVPAPSPLHLLQQDDTTVNNRPPQFIPMNNPPPFAFPAQPTPMQQEPSHNEMMNQQQVHNIHNSENNPLDIQQPIDNFQAPPSFNAQQQQPVNNDPPLPQFNPMGPPPFRQPLDNQPPPFPGAPPVPPPFMHPPFQQPPRMNSDMFPGMRPEGGAMEPPRMNLRPPFENNGGFNLEINSPQRFRPRFPPNQTRHSNFRPRGGFSGPRGGFGGPRQFFQRPHRPVL